MKSLCLSFIFLTSLSSFSCPLGVNEKHLTIQRVMRNFGRFIMPAEMISVRSQNSAEVITDQQLEEAIVKLNHVISCAQAVIDEPTGDLIPVSARRLSKDQLVAYIEDLVFYMDEFKELVIIYQELFIKESGKPLAERNFLAIQKHTKRQDAMIDRAHQKLMGD